MLANTYDLAGRQLTAAQTLPGMTGGGQTVSYSYNNGSGDTLDRSQIVWPDGWLVNYAYDATGHMTSAIDSDGTHLATLAYDNLGHHATTQYPSAQDNVLWSWNSLDDLASLTDNFSSATNDVAFNNTLFNPAHQVVGVTITNAAYKYAPPSAPGTDSYAAANGLNQYTSITPAGGSAQAITYDARGNLTSDGTYTFVYDPENHLMKASKSGTNASYLYDPLGRRTTKTVNAIATNFLHDGDTEIAELDGSGHLQRRFVPGVAIDEPIAMVTCTGSGCAGSTATKTMFHVDKMGSVVAMSNASNGQLAAGPFTYDSYGGCVSGGNPCSVAGTPYLYTGQRLDPETGLYYYRARYYSAALGRFLQIDPVGYAVDVNAYTYGDNDPTDNSDPSGMASCPTKDSAECPSSTGTGGPKEHPRPNGGCGSRISGGGQANCRLHAGQMKNQGCNLACKREFIETHLADATAAAKEIGGSVTPAEILGLAALESGWGRNRYAKVNNYFGQHGKAKYAVPGAREGCAQGCAGGSMAVFTSFHDSAMSFAAEDGNLVRNAATSSDFARVLQDSGKFGINADGSHVLTYVSSTSATIDGIQEILDSDKPWRPFQ